MPSRLFLWALTSALAGFLFGFDTVVISGAEKTIQSVWSLGHAQHGLAMSMALWGTVLGSLVGGWPTDRFGRKATLLWIGILYLVSAIWSGLATDVYSFMIARFIGGVGVGISTVAAPLYISEIAPPERRGRLAGMFQFNIVFGILVAYASNALLAGLGENAWRWMLGVEAIPALIYSLMCIGLPESPRWLISERGDIDEATRVLQLANPEMSADEVSRLVDQIRDSSVEHSSSEPFWTWRMRVPIMLAFLVAFFNQLSGINAILYFAPRIFEMTGLGQEAALLQSIGIGVVNLLFTFVGLYLIDRLGRRTLLYVGSFGYIASLGLCAWVFLSYAPQFQVANSAIAVKSSIETLQKAEALPVRNDLDIAKFSAQVDDAKNSLVLASNSPDYAGEAVKFLPTDNSDAVLATADNAMVRASEESGFGGRMVMLCIFAFIAAHAVGQGAVIWVLISEVFPNRHRAAGQSLGSFTHWIFAALITLAFPWFIGNFAPSFVFGFFCFMMVLQLIWVATMVPETKGVPLEEMEARLTGA
ncbi:sugar porter family MFS transporter [Allorhodopirellula heiligendammensis]|uniref:D-xylose-proton symporter n=1 Tax=Allorhodopirellula heiligendammensis TaxID=2714739 RepID=A0A5C6BV63_9BACT|nr:sugar porter family MFS transporter [Allorhodopirellula heiligendammensis]TWU15106.1 D-xylose-proton symporter [Allorhodopirellula heiligendammensis]